MEWWFVIPIVTACGLYVTVRAYRAGRRLSTQDPSSCGCGCKDCPEANRSGGECLPGARGGPLMALFMLACVTTPVGARAADTIETWAAGATDMDFYLGLDGLGRPAARRSLGADIMVGHGITQGFSVYLGTTVATEGGLADGAGALYTGLFGTPLDSDHFDLDLLLNFELAGRNYDQFQVAPGVELVFSSRPDMLGWGLYLRGFAGLTGEPAESGQDSHAVHLELASTLGAFVTLAEDHQVLLEIDGAWRPWHDPADPRLELGGLALGYNLTLSPTIELIHQVFVDLPQARAEPIAVGVRVGFIASLPAGGV